MFDKLWTKIKPAVFKYKKNKIGIDDDKIYIGVMAQDIIDGLSEEGYNIKDFSIINMEDTGYYSVDYIQLIPILISRIKKLEKEIEIIKKGDIL